MDKKGQRWFCTGDIGEFHGDGCLKIIGEKLKIPLFPLNDTSYCKLTPINAADKSFKAQPGGTGQLPASQTRVEMKSSHVYIVFVRVRP